MAADDETEGLDITTRVLISIRDEIRQTNQRLEQLREETRDGLQQVREETRIGLKTVHDSLSLRLDRVIETTGQHCRDLASRVANLELQVAAMQHG